MLKKIHYQDLWWKEEFNAANLKDFLRRQSLTKCPPRKEKMAHGRNQGDLSFCSKPQLIAVIHTQSLRNASCVT